MTKDANNGSALIKPFSLAVKLGFKIDPIWFYFGQQRVISAEKLDCKYPEKNSTHILDWMSTNGRKIFSVGWTSFELPQWTSWRRQLHRSLRNHWASNRLGSRELRLAVSSATEKSRNWYNKQGSYTNKETDWCYKNLLENHPKPSRLVAHVAACVIQCSMCNVISAACTLKQHCSCHHLWWWVLWCFWCE